MPVLTLNMRMYHLSPTMMVCLLITYTQSLTENTVVTVNMRLSQ